MSRTPHILRTILNLRNKFSPPPQARKHARALLAEELEERVLLFGDSMDMALEVLLTPGQQTELAGTLGDEDYGARDVDLFRVDLTGGEQLTIDVDAQALDDGGWLSDADSYLRVFDEYGGELVANNDAADPDSGTNSVDPALVFTAPETGGYYLGLSLYPNTDYDPWSEQRERTGIDS